MIFVENKVNMPYDINELNSLKSSILENFKNLHSRLNLAEIRLYPNSEILKQILLEDIDLEEQNKYKNNLAENSLNAHNSPNAKSGTYFEIMQEADNLHNHGTAGIMGKSAENSDLSTENNVTTIFQTPKLENSVNYFSVSNWSEYLSLYKKDFNDNIRLNRKINEFRGHADRFNVFSLTDQKRHKLKEKLEIKKLNDSYFDLLFDKEKEIYGYLDNFDKFGEQYGRGLGAEGNRNDGGKNLQNKTDHLNYDKESIQTFPYKGVDKEFNQIDTLNRKNLSNPDYDLNQLRKIVTSGPRSTLFYVNKKNPKDPTRSLKVRCNELDWLHRAQHLWVELLFSNNFQDFIKMINDWKINVN